MTSIASTCESVAAVTDLAQQAGAVAMADAHASLDHRGSHKPLDHNPCDPSNRRRERYFKHATVQAAVCAARALHEPQSTTDPAGPRVPRATVPSLTTPDATNMLPSASISHADPSAGAVLGAIRRRPAMPETLPTAQQAPTTLERLPELPVYHAAYKVPTFTDHQGWAWMLPMCVSRYVLLASIAQRTETPNQGGGEFEAHAMGMLYNSTVHVWQHGADKVMHANKVGPTIVAAHERTHPEQHIIYVDGRWAHYDSDSNTTQAAAVSAEDSLYACLLHGFAGHVPTTSEVAACRKNLANFMRAECNRESFAAKALLDVQQRLKAFAAGDPPRAQRLHGEWRAYTPVQPPAFVWDGETWPHPACAAAPYLLQNLIHPMRQMGAWGSELEAETAAHAMNWRVHMWKPCAGESSHGWFWSKSLYERVNSYGPPNGAPVHVVNIIDNKHYAQFVPESKAWQGASTQPLRLSGQVTDCGAGGNCLYFSMLGSGSTESDVACLRIKMVRYVLARPDAYQDIASEAVDIRWNDFLASRPLAAARIAKQAALYCARQLEANHFATSS